MKQKGLRRTVQALGVAVAVGVLITSCSVSPHTDSGSPQGLGPAASGSKPVAAETAELASLYRAAMRDGGHLTVWAGGDAPDQQDELAQQLRARFPRLKVDIKVDLSKYHDLRVDAALEGSGRVPDVAMLQTTFDFDRWSAQGALLPFKPVGFEKQMPGYAHADGEYLTAVMLGFQPTYASSMRAGSRPTRYEDFLKPQFANGKLALTPPHDDDAVLYVYEQLERRFGVAFLDRLRDQHPRWIRGTAVPAFLVGKQGVLGNLTGYAGIPGSTAIVPADDEPLITWAQRAAVFRNAPNTSAGKLFLAFVASKEYQSTYDGWRTRTDLPPAQGLPPLSALPGTDPSAFVRFMADRDGVAATRKRMERIFGPVTGESPLLDSHLLEVLGLSEDRATASPLPKGPVS